VLFKTFTAVHVLEWTCSVNFKFFFIGQLHDSFYRYFSSNSVCFSFFLIFSFHTKTTFYSTNYSEAVQLFVIWVQKRVELVPQHLLMTNEAMRDIGVINSWLLLSEILTIQLLVYISWYQLWTFDHWYIDTKCGLHRCWWWMLGTKCVGDYFKMLVTVLTFLVTNTQYLFTLVSGTNIREISPINNITVIQNSNRKILRKSIPILSNIFLRRVQTSEKRFQMLCWKYI